MTAEQIIRVLIADDHEAVRAGVSAILATATDIEVVAEAADGFEAVVLCLQARPDVALVDVRMPGADGIWAAERITAQSDTRVAMLTTFGDDELVARALAAGAHGYLLKSLGGTELLQAVRHLASGRHVLDPEVTAGVIAAARTPLRHEPPEPATQFTPREQEVLELIAEGLSNQAIADRLHVGITTVKAHVGALYSKTGATSRVALATYAAS